MTLSTPFGQIEQPSGESAVRRAVKQLRQGIVAGDFLPGTRMRQERLADLLGMSRGPIRLALFILEREGLVVADRLRGGMVVAPLNVVVIRELYEFRASVERFVAETLAKKPTFDAKPVGDIVRQGIAATESRDIARLIDLDWRFHALLYDAVGNRVLSDVMNSHWTHTQRGIAATVKVHGYPDTVWDEHVAILDSIENHDSVLAGTRAMAHMVADSNRMIENLIEDVALAMRPACRP
jgi:DNA-binding GntR family transcriptional regulator